MRISGVFGLGCVLGLLTAASGWAAPVTIRPQQAVSVSNVANPANAIDDNLATFSSMSLQRVCRDDHNEALVNTATFDGFPAGYRALRVEVHWYASAVFAVMQSNTAAVTAKVEYYAGAGWRALESETWNAAPRNCPMVSDGSLTCLDHSATTALPAGLDAARVRVRVTLRGAFASCTASGPTGIANLSAQAKIYDVRLMAEKAPASAPRKGTGKRTAHPKTP
jgi:hypothetical protein